MLYLFALIGMITVVAVLWAAFGPRKPEQGRPQRQLGPDDDPDFLRRLREQQRRDDPS